MAITEAAPLIVAREFGMFSRQGLHVELHREIGWATLRDKVLYDELDAVQAPAAMLWTVQLGLGCPPHEVLTALVLNLHAGALTLSTGLWNAGVRDGATLREYLASGQRSEPLNFGVSYLHSSQHLMLRDWLRAAGIDPGRQLRIVVVPAGHLSLHLAAGTLDGFHSSEPWNSLAVHAGIGWCPSWSGVRPPGIPAKVLMVTRGFAESRPEDHRALLHALTEAGAWCDDPRNRSQLVELLAQPEYLKLPASVIGPSLLGQLDCGHARIESVPHFHVFQRGEAGRPSPARASALQRAFAAAGMIPAPTAGDALLPRQLLRDDLYREYCEGRQPVRSRV